MLLGGAFMPFYSPSKEPNHTIDYDKFKTVYTYFHTDFEGKIRPIQFTYETDDNTRITLKIDNIKYSKEIQGGTLFCCLVTNYARQQEIKIVYFTSEHQWCLVIE